MTSGQRRAARELERLRAVSPDVFQVAQGPELIDGWLVASISLRLGPIEKREGGLDLREREEFILCVPSGFPFAIPTLVVSHNRFAGFPHVTWSTNLCLYQSSQVEWNPSDGLYGFFDRLNLWLARAAMNDMDPLEGPLEPPHHVTDFSQIPFVIRSNAPVEPGMSWVGLAELEKFPNRLELVGWNDLSSEWPGDRYPALAVVLPKALPMEFPKMGKEFFAELAKQGVDKERVLANLRFAAQLTPENESAYLVLGIPMRRSSDGKPKHHVAVWSIAPETSRSLKLAAPSGGDQSEIVAIKSEINTLIYELFESRVITWCQVMEDRNEIVVRRDSNKPMTFFSGKKVLVLGCGALGSWAAEVVARANCSVVHLVDNSIVKPGLLVRQNYRLDDIGAKKSEALAKRISAISAGVSVEFSAAEAHRFIFHDLSRFRSYDIVLDCTASSIFQMKLERDWSQLEQRTPPIISMIIDASAQRCLSVVLGADSVGGIWDGYFRLKYKLCTATNHDATIEAFYSERAAKNLFQPEPGCSDPTFSGSMADVGTLAFISLNLSVEKTPDADAPIGISFSIPSVVGQSGLFETFKLPEFDELRVGDYRVRISSNVFREARAWARENKRTRSRDHETGGILWGFWDDATNVLWVLDASGPPPDSRHDPGHFICGVQGTAGEHRSRMQRSRGVCGFIGYWHTHPDMISEQSNIDIYGMAELVSAVGQNQKRALMMIFGRTLGKPSAGIYCYESQSLNSAAELLVVGSTQMILKQEVV